MTTALGETTTGTGTALGGFDVTGGVEVTAAGGTGGSVRVLSFSVDGRTLRVISLTPLTFSV